MTLSEVRRSECSVFNKDWTKLWALTFSTDNANLLLTVMKSQCYAMYQ